jgi:hypothetical protein
VRPFRDSDPPGFAGYRVPANGQISRLTRQPVGRTDRLFTMSDEANRGITPERYWPMVVVVMMFGWWARATYGVGLTAIIMGVWLLMGSVAGATWIVNRWNRWWVWGTVSVVFVLLAAAALEFITIVEEF